MQRRVYDVPEGEFRAAVADSLSLRESIRRLDLHDHTNTYHRLRHRIEDLGLDISHMCGAGRRPRRFTEAQLREAVANSRSFRQTLLALGIKAEGGNYRTVRRDISKLGLSTQHFSGQGWRRAHTEPVRPAKPLTAILVKDSSASTSHVRKRLLTAGLLAPRCAVCGLSKWRGRPLTLELDHINGVNNDHRLENLRLVCPNCHSQTDTFRGRNVKLLRRHEPMQLSIL